MVQVNYGAGGGWPDELVPRKARKLSFSGPVNPVEGLNGPARSGFMEDMFHLDLEIDVVEKTTAPELFLKFSRHWPERVPGCDSLA